MSESNRALARRWFEEVWNGRRPETIDELLSPSIVGTMEGGDVRSPDDFKAARRTLLEAFPDLKVTVEDVVAEGDQAVVRWSAKARHTGSGLGFAATGRAAAFRGISWLVFSEGKIVRGWDSWNLGALLQSLAVAEVVVDPETRERRG